MDKVISRRRFRFTIQKKLLFIMLLVALVPLFLFGSLAYVRLHDSILQQAAERMQATSLITMTQINRTYELAEQTLASWAKLEVLQDISEGDREGRVAELFRDYQQTFGYFSTLVAVNLEGEVVAAGDTKLEGVSVANSSWFKRALDLGGYYKSSLESDWLLGGFGMNFVMPIINPSSNQLIGLLKASLDWQELKRQINVMDPQSGRLLEDYYALIINREGNVLVAPDFVLDTLMEEAEGSDLTMYGKPGWLQENQGLLSNLFGPPQLFQINEQGRKLMLTNRPVDAFSSLKGMDWSLVVVHDASKELAAIDQIRNQAYFIALLALLFIGVASYSFARQIGRPIARLSRWAEELSEGHLDRSIRVRSRDELSELSSSLDHMRGNLKSIFNELLDAKERYRDLINSVECIVWEASIEPIQINLISGNVEAVLGCSAEEVKARLIHWQDYVANESHDVVISGFRDAIANQRNTYVEFKVRNDNGDWVWVKLLLAVMVVDERVVGVRGVVFDISNIVRATEEMAQARDIAVKTAKDKNRFMALVSHEVRTPMNGMLGMLELLDEPDLSTPQKHHLELAREAGRNLLTLVDDVVDYTRLQSGGLQPSLEDANLHELLISVVRFVAVDVYSKGLDIGLAMEANLPSRLWLDDGKLRRILIHLLANAVKFTRHGSIVVWAEMLSGSRLYIEVKDTGVGIPGSKQQVLFEPFTQADLSSTRRYSGSGIGLALCRGLVELLGGEIGVRSIENVGSSFYIELPVGISGEETKAVSDWQAGFKTEAGQPGVLMVGDMPATQMVIKLACQQWGLAFHWVPKANQVADELGDYLLRQGVRWLFVAQEVGDRFWQQLAPYLNEQQDLRVIQLRLPTGRTGQRPLPHLYVPFSPRDLAQLMLSGVNEKLAPTAQSVRLADDLPRVLVVDDNEVNRRVACGYLKKLGFQSDVAEDGQKALSAVKSTRYGAVFMDCQMPVMDGYQATQEIRRYLDGVPLPIIAVTAHAMAGDREKCLAAGMDDYIAKPLRMDVMQQVILRWLPQITAHSHQGAPKA